MGLIDRAFGPLRSVLGNAEHGAEREVERVLPVGEVEAIQTQILDGMNAVRRATESIDSHVAVVATLANSLTPMTAALTALTARLGELQEVLAPIAALEREIATAEHDVSRATHLFRRHGQPDGPPTEPTAG